jgi:hypothetical protein
MTLVPRPKVDEKRETIPIEEMLKIATSHYLVTMKIPGTDVDVVLSPASLFSRIQKIKNTSDMPKYAIITRNLNGQDTVVRLEYVGSQVECLYLMRQGL